MKKTVLVLLMTVMVATPCFAQEVEPERPFSIEGTVWKALPIGLQIFPVPGIWNTDDLQFGFYGSTVYPGLEPDEDSFCINMLMFSIFSTCTPSITTQQGGVGVYSTNYYGILQPIGIGMVVRVHESYYPFPDISIALLIKTGVRFIPPEELEAE